ncbi:MAG: sulfur carrier protein ThiS [Planctomycetota bacterium]
MLKINGVEKQFPAGQLPPTVAELLKQLGIEAATVVAEVDGQIVEYKKFTRTRLCSGQSIELVRFVAGGGARNAKKRSLGTC